MIVYGRYRSNGANARFLVNDSQPDKDDFSRKNATTPVLWALASFALAAVFLRTSGIVHAPTAAAISLGIHGICALGLLLPSQRWLRWTRPAAASMRAGTLFVLCAQWASEAREVLGALCVAVLWRDIRTGESAERPLLPIALGLSWALAWTVVRPSDAVPRVAAVAAVAALGLRERWWSTKD